MPAASPATAREILPSDSARLRELLDSGRDDSGSWVRPVAVSDDGVVLEHFAPTSAPGPAVLWRQAIRAISLTATLTPAVAAALLGLVLNRPFFGVTAALALLGAVLLQVAVNLLNDVEDHRRLIDLPGALGGAGVIQQGWVSARRLERVAFVCLVIGVACGLPAVVREPSLLIVGALGVLGAFGYSGRPFGLKYRALGDVAVFACCGPALTIGMALAASGVWDAADALLGVVFGAAAVGILHANNLQDRVADRTAGAVTLATLVGERTGAALLITWYAVAVAAWIGLAVRVDLPLFAALLPAIALVAIARVVKTTLSEPSHTLLRVFAAQAHLLMGVVVAAAFGAALVLR